MNNNYKLKENDIKNCTYYFFDDMISVKVLNPNKNKLDEKPHKNIYYVLYYVGYVTPNSVKPLHFITNKINEYIEESNGSKYLTLVLADERKVTLKNIQNYGKTRILLDQQAITQMIMITNT